MRKIFLIGCLAVLTTACWASAGAPTATLPAVPTTTPSLTPQPSASPTPPPELGTIALDFAALVCDAHWMNGAQQLQCPAPLASRPGGYAQLLDPLSQGLAPGTPVLLTMPALPPMSSIFGRYPPLAVHAGDRFRSTLRCQNGAACNVEFALEYYDAAGKYHSEFGRWQYQAGQAPIQADLDLGPLAGQTVDFTLAVRPQDDAPQNDLALWIAPHIFRPLTAP